MRNILKSIAFIALSLSLFTVGGCGDSGSSGSSQSTPVNKTGYLLGTLIEGLPYTCGTVSGRTGRLSHFTYQVGQPCTFKLGEMSFNVAADKLERGYITPYDLTATKEEAWTLVAIIDSISYLRPNSDLFLIVDNHLEHRIPAVNLAQGNAAVSAALKPFNGTLVPVDVQEAHQRIAKIVNDNNALLYTHDELVAMGKALLDSLGLPVEYGQDFVESQAVASSSAKKSMTYHNNIVNLRFYDADDYRLNLKDATISLSDPSSIWVTPGQNDANNTPYAEIATYGSKMNTHIQSNNNILNVVTVNLTAGRHKSTGPADSFFTSAQATSPGFPNRVPTTVLANGTHGDKNMLFFPDELNFGFKINLSGSDIYGNSFYCKDLMFGQGSSKPGKGALYGFLLASAATALDGIAVVAEGGVNPLADFGFFVGIAGTVYAGVDALLEFQNWWLMAVGATTESFHVLYQANNGENVPYPASLVLCSTIPNGSTQPQRVPIIITSTTDDHTFDVIVSFKDQAFKYLKSVK